MVNCSVTCGATFHNLVEWMMELQHVTYEGIKVQFDFRTEPIPTLSVAFTIPDPVPGGISHSCTGKKFRVISQCARVSSSRATSMCDCFFFFGEVPESRRCIDRLSPIILIGRTAEWNIKNGTMRPIDSPSATGVTA